MNKFASIGIEIKRQLIKIKSLTLGKILNHIED